MTTAIVDASVALKWILPEEHSVNALELLERADELVAPDLIIAEAGNTFWKRVARDQMTGQEAHAALAVFCRLPLRIESHSPWVRIALELALRIGCTAYDALYLALAIVWRAPMVTADRPLFERIAASPLSAYVRWVADPFG